MGVVPVDRIVHLGAQAGVGYSLVNPQAYVRSNLLGHVNMLELARARDIAHFVYASSSSVYGGNTKLPFAVSDPVDRPISLYAETKVTAEEDVLSRSNGLATTCLRFATVYGTSPRMRFDLTVNEFTRDLAVKGELVVFGEQHGAAVQFERPGGARGEASPGQHPSQRGRRVVRIVPVPERVPLGDGAGDRARKRGGRRGRDILILRGDGHRGHPQKEEQARFPMHAGQYDTPLLIRP